MKVEDELRELIISRYRSLRQFALDIDMPYSTIDTMLKKGVGKAGVLNVIKICNELGIDTDALADGYIKEKTINDISVTASEMTHIKKYRSLSIYDKETVDGLVDRLVVKERETSYTYTKPEYLTGLSAGTGLYVFDDVPCDTIQVPEEYKDADFVISVSGDSMEPTFFDKDKVAIKKGLVHVGEIGAFMVDGEALIKELGNNKLISHNKDYPDKELKEGMRVDCIGKVLGKL